LLSNRVNPAADPRVAQLRRTCNDAALGAVGYRA
jgi:hypothetical protein